MSTSQCALSLIRGEFGGKLEPFAVILFCTAANLDRKTRSKRSRMLRYAAKRKLDFESFEEFIKREGGINECAARWAQR